MAPRRAPRGATNDREIVDGLRRGDPRAWARLCEAYAEPLYLYAYHRTGGSEAAAEDVRQETLLAAARSISSFNGRAPLFSWLCGIARRKVADEARRRGREGTRIEVFEDGALPPAAEPVGTLLGREPLPDELVERAETRAAVVEALWRLPSDYRVALVRRYVRGENVNSISTALGRTYKATESLLSRAREAFRRSLVEVESLERARARNR